MAVVRSPDFLRALNQRDCACNIDPPASYYAIMRRAGPYRGENPGPGKDVDEELDPRPGIREQPGSVASHRYARDARGMSAFAPKAAVLRKAACTSTMWQVLLDRVSQ